MINELKFKNKLNDLGLSKSESEIYITLLKKGKASVSELAKDSKFHRSNIYDLLKSLVKKGMASYCEEDNNKYYMPADPNRTLHIIMQKKDELLKHEQELKKILPDFLKLQLDNGTDIEVKVFSGKEGVKNLFEDVLKEKKEFLCFGSTGISPEIIPYGLSRFHKERIKKKIRWRVIYNGDAKGKRRGLETKNWRFTEVRFMRKASPSTTYCYGNKIAIALWNKKRPVCIVIKDKEISKSYKQFFEVLWKHSIQYLGEKKNV